MAAEFPDCVIMTVPLLREHEIPVPEPPEIELESVTLPVNPDKLETVITSVPELPETMVVEGEFADIPKSPTFKVIMIK